MWLKNSDSDEKYTAIGNHHVAILFQALGNPSARLDHIPLLLTTSADGTPCCDGGAGFVVGPTLEREVFSATQPPLFFNPHKLFREKSFNASSRGKKPKRPACRIESLFEHKMRTPEVVAVFNDAGLYRGRDIHKIHALCDEAVQTLYMTTVDETPRIIGAIVFRIFKTADGTCVYLLELLATVKDMQKLGVGRDLVDAMKSHIPPFCNGLPRIITQAANTAWQKIASRDDPAAAAAFFAPNPAAAKMLVALHVLDPHVLIDLPAFQLECGENGVQLVDKNIKTPQSPQRNVTRLQAFGSASHSGGDGGVQFTYPLLYSFVR